MIKHFGKAQWRYHAKNSVVPCLFPALHLLQLGNETNLFCILLLTVLFGSI